MSLFFNKIGKKKSKFAVFTDNRPTFAVGRFAFRYTF